MALNTNRNGVRDIEKQSNDDRNVCAIDICNAMSNLRLCGQCKIARYCCKEHQKLDWKNHKTQCMKDRIVGSLPKPEVRHDQAHVPREAAGSSYTTTARPKPESHEVHFTLGDSYDAEPDDHSTTAKTKSTDEQYTTIQNPSTKTFGRTQSSSSTNSASSSSLSSRCSSGLSSSSSTSLDTSFQIQLATTDEINEKQNEQIASDLQSQIQKESAIFSASLGSGYPLKPFEPNNKGFGDKPPLQEGDTTTRDSILKDLVRRVVNNLTKQHGICVLDNFLDYKHGLAILKEVQHMHSSGQFQDGQVVRSRDDDSSKIRGDQITWRNGDEPDCTNISFLISVLDSILALCNGKLEDYNINGRTKAMIACYPGNGTRYVRHVDNPNNDGRCITCIYYLNKNWDVLKDGGLLKVYPEGAKCAASIAPLFNRLLFFYSDRRNPHEVFPAYATRFAITVWYLDGNQKSTVKRPLNKLC